MDWLVVSAAANESRGDGYFIPPLTLAGGGRRAARLGGHIAGSRKSRRKAARLFDRARPTSLHLALPFPGRNVQVAEQVRD